MKSRSISDDEEASKRIRRRGDGQVWDVDATQNIPMTGRATAWKGSLIGTLALVALAIICLVGSAGAQTGILYTLQSNPPPPNLPSGTQSYAAGQTWASEVCSSSNQPFPAGSQTEWNPILDPGQDAETHLVAVSGNVVYNPDPGESGYCQGTTCPGQPVFCSDDSDCNSCGGTCDLGQGPSCSGGSCNSPWGKTPVGSPIACVNDAQCAAACGGTCAALGRSRADLQMTHPFGFDYDASIAPDPAYLSLLSPGNVESTHLDPSDSSGQSALDGFGDVVYPYIHATTRTDQTTKGWCSPDFNTRCASSSECPSGSTCEGALNGLGLGLDSNSSFPGVLGMETDHDLFPDSYQPRDGDRIAVFGRWIVDCGHGDEMGSSGWHTEIHPPLLVATARSDGGGFFGAKCSGDETCSSVISRPYLVGQYFGDGYFAPHLAHELGKLGCVGATGPAISGFVAIAGPYAGLPDCSLGLDPTCVCNGDGVCGACEVGSCLAIIPPPFGFPCTQKLEARPEVSGVPFAGTQEMQYYIRPASRRINPGDRMLVAWQLTARDGVKVALSDSGTKGVLVDIVMNQSEYPPAPLPPKQDWVVKPNEISPGFALLGLLDIVPVLDVSVQAAIVDRGLFTDRYQAPEAPLNGNDPSYSFADQLDSGAQAAGIYDGQPFPVSGRINVGWFRCTPGGPYVAECAGPTTTVALDGNGSRDPDGNALTFAWSGGFQGGSASSATPLVAFAGTGKFPVDLSVADNHVSTECSTTAVIRDTTPPAIMVSQPMAVRYPHSATLTLAYGVTDICSSVSFTSAIDGGTTLAGHGLQSGQAINLLTELALGPHTFSISARDGAGNSDTSSVTFTIIVTPNSIKADVAQFQAMGAIGNQGLANSLLSELDAASNARAEGNCTAAGNIYQALINELEGQDAKGVDGNATATMIADAQYLITHCP